MARVVLDSSFLIAMFYEGDVHFEKVSRVLNVEENQYFISAITLAETLTHAARQGPEELAAMVTSIKGAMTEIIHVDEELAIEAAGFRSRTRTKIPDAIISATATRLGAQLWTLDKKLAKAHKGAVLVA